MDWNFPKPEEDSWYRKAYDHKYGKGAFERDFLNKQNEEQTQTEAKISSDFTEITSPFKHYWNSEHNVGVLERNGKYIGVCVLAAKEVVDKESYVRKFGLDFRKDIQWSAASSLIEHLSRSPLFKAMLVTTKKIPFSLQPDTPKGLEGRKNWIERNLHYHKEVLDTLNTDVRASRESGMFPIPEELLKRQKDESLNVTRFLDKKKSIESQIQEHTKPYYIIKDNVFAAALFFYIYTSIHDTFEEAVKEIISRKEATKKEAALTYFVKCSDVTDPVIVFSPSFPPYWEEVDKYYNLALGKDVAGFESDKGVALVLRKMFTTALELPEDEVVIEEKIHIPTEEVSIEGPRKAFIGYVASSVVKNQVTKRRVYFPLDILTRHAVTYGVTRSGKSLLALILIREALANGIKVVVFDPHGSIANRLKPSENLMTFRVSGEITDKLREIYNMASSWDETNKLRLLVVLDETKLLRARNLVNCLNELGKRGVSFLLITQYSTSLPPEARNVGTYFILSAMTEVEMERFHEVTLHPSSNLISRLPRATSFVFSPYFYPEPFFVRHRFVE